MARSAGNQIAVIGLGRFGSSMAVELERRGCEVLAIDHHPRRTQQFADELTHVATVDSTDDEALRQLGVDEVQRAVVAIGTDLEASVLTTSVLADFAVPHIWAKATSRQQARILERVGAEHVVLPEHDMGERLAHLVTGRMLDYIQVEQDFAMAKTRSPAEAVGRRLDEARLRTKYGITIVGIKRPGEDFTYATADTVLQDGDTVIVSGKPAQIERFADVAR